MTGDDDDGNPNDRPSRHPIFEWLKVPGANRHDLPGYYALADLPQAPPISQMAVSTGWHDLDRIWRLYPGQFTVVTGTAGSGKSTFLFNIVCNVARISGLRTFLYVPENERLVRERLRSIWGTHEGFDCFCKEQCFVQSSADNRWEDPQRTPQWVLERSMKAVENDNVDLILIDPWNELEHLKPRDWTMTDYIRACLAHIKSICRNVHCMVILVAHPTKEGLKDGKTPTLIDIEGSLSWYNKCDNGLIVARESDDSVTKVISAKVREVGAGQRGKCFFHVDKLTGRFTPLHVEEQG